MENEILKLIIKELESTLGNNVKPEEADKSVEQCIKLLKSLLSSEPKLDPDFKNNF